MIEYEKGDSDIKEAFDEISKMQPDLEKNLKNLEAALNEPEIESIFPMSDEIDDEIEDDHNNSYPTAECTKDVVNSNRSYYAEIRSLNIEQ